MLSGHQVLPVFDDALTALQQRAAVIDRTVNDLNARLLALRNEESEAYRSLARIRLGAAADDAMIQRLTMVDASVRAALQRLSAASETVDQRIAEITAKGEALRAERARALAVLEERRAALEAAQQAAVQRLEATPDYQQASSMVNEAEGIAAAAEQKLAQAEADRAEKGQPYHDDELFQYLWQRGYGTSRYGAGGLARMIDRWLARVTGYDEARARYGMLLEIPRRLAEHAQRRREEAEARRAALAELQNAAVSGGELDALRADLDRAEAAVEALDDTIEANGNQAVEAIGRRLAVTRGEDPVVRTAAEVIENALRQQGLVDLRAAAQRTPTPEDDAVVHRLAALEAEAQKLLPTIEQAKAEQEALRRQLAEIGAVRRDYRQRGFNRGTFDAAAGGLIGSLLSELLRGGMSRDVFWDRMGQQRQPQPRSWPGGGWGGGGRGGSGAGQSGGGDFRTGGGF